MGLTSLLYKYARASADFDAVKKGPVAVIKRLINKKVGRAVHPKVHMGGK